MATGISADFFSLDSALEGEAATAEPEDAAAAEVAIAAVADGAAASFGLLAEA